MNKIIQQLKKSKLLVFDFDGVMTDNRVLVSQDGTEAVFCNRSDGLGVSMLREAGYKMLILSTEKNSVVATRARKLRLDVTHGTEDKKTTLTDYCTERNILLSSVAYIGNDINDLEVMRIAGKCLCPLDAHKTIKDISDIIIPVNGGDGVIRYFADLITRGK